MNKYFLLSMVVWINAIVNSMPSDIPVVQKKDCVELSRDLRAVFRYEIANLFNTFIPELLEEQDKIILEQQKLFLLTLEKAIPCQYADEYISVLLLLCDCQKEMLVKIELLATNLLEDSLPTSKILHLQVKVFQRLCDFVRDCWPCVINTQLAVIKERYFNNGQMTKYLLSLLPGLPKQSFFVSRWVKATAAARADLRAMEAMKEMRKLIVCEMYAAYPTLFNQYANIIRQYRTESYMQQGQAFERFLIELEQVIEHYEKEDQELLYWASEIKNPHLAYSLVQSSHRILNLFTEKLLYIKSELLALFPKISDAVKLSIWLRYLAIKSSFSTNKVFLQNKDVSIFFDSMQKSVLSFISPEGTSSLFVNQILFTVNKVQKWLKHSERVMVAKIFQKNNDEFEFVSELFVIVEQICFFMIRTTQDSFVKELLTTSLAELQLSTKDQNDASKKIIIDTAEHVTGQKFNNIKDVFLHTMRSASPYVATYLLSLLLPYLSQEVRQPITEIIAQQKNASPSLPKDDLSQFIGSQGASII